MADPKASPEEEFRSALEDVLSVLTKMRVYFASLDEVLEQVKLAVENETHLQLLMTLLKQKR